MLSRLLKPRPAGPAALADAAYHAAFEAERAFVLRRRIAICLGVILALLAISGMGSVFEYQEAVEGKTPWMVFLVGVVYDLSVACMSVALMLYVLTRRPDRRRLVAALIVWALAATAVIVYFEMRRSLIHPTTWLGDPLPGADPAQNACRWGLVGAGVVVVLSLLIVPMRVRESRWIGVGGVAVFSLLAVLVAGAGPALAVPGALLLSLLGAAAMGFSHWRYTLFDADFEHRELKDRYGELSSELAHARNLHESLFPPRRTDGPVRVGFAYEPMREIGGDFLFMPAPPDPPDPADPDPPTYLVLIDVSGHGVASALAVNRLHGELVRLFAVAAASKTGRGLSAGDVMTALNTYVQLTLAPQTVFATGVCLKIERTGGAGQARLEWCSAGHPPVLLRSAAAVGGGAATVHPLGATATMLGVLDTELFDAKVQSIPVVPGDTIIAYTDGLIETRDESGDDLGIPAVERIVREWGTTPPAAPPAHAPGEKPPHDPPIATALLAAAAAKRGSGRVTDDTLIVELTIAPAGQSPEVPQRVSTPAASGSASRSD